jgi:hypothetical protein
MAKDMGIKPGSRAFHEMKRNARESLEHMGSVTASRQKHDQKMQKEHEQKMKRDSRGGNNGKSR